MDERPTTAELLEAWRDTTRAAELAERLASFVDEIRALYESAPLPQERNSLE